jgi:hypothetical protein
MLKSKDILVQKAKEVKSLKAGIEEDKSETPREDLHPQIQLNESGKKVLVFSDPLYSTEKRSIVNYAMFRGKWEFENLDNIDETDLEKCGVKFVPVRDSSNFTIAFKSLKDRVEFMNSIYSDNEMKQTGSGVNLEKIANSKVLKATGGLIGLSFAGYKLYKLLKKN